MIGAFGWDTPRRSGDPSRKRHTIGWATLHKRLGKVLQFSISMPNASGANLVIQHHEEVIVAVG
jgi:hypothetical protein